MRIIILAGGQAKRLWPLTEDFPKTLLRIAGKPVLSHLLENVAKISDIEDITISIDEKQKQHFIKNLNIDNLFLSPHPRFSVHCSDRYGTAIGPMRKIKEIFSDLDKTEKESDFLILAGDNVFGFNLEEFTSYYHQRGLSCIAIQNIINPISITRFGVPSLDHSGRLTSMIERPVISKISTACYAIRGDDLNLVSEFLDTNPNDNLGEYISWAITKTEFVAYCFQYNWFDIGTRNEMIAANTYFLNIPEYQKVPSMIPGYSKILPPVHIKEPVLLVDSFIGPNVYIEKNVRIDNSTIENSIIYEGCHICNSTMQECIIGSDSIIYGNIRKTKCGANTHFVQDIEQ